MLRASLISLRRAMARVGMFGLSTVLSALIAVITIPITVHLAGVDIWADASVGMAVGAIVATVVSLGWPITGVAKSAVLDREQRGLYFAASISSRSLLILPGLAVAAGTAWAVAPGDRVVCMLSALTFSMQGLSANWFFVGTNDPIGLLLCDAAVRAITLAIAIVVVVSSGAPILLFGLQLVGALVSVACTMLWIARRTAINPLGLIGLRAGLRHSSHQFHGSITSIVASLYQSLPLLIVSYLVPSATSVFAVADRLLKLSNTAGQPFVQVIQSWIPADAARLHERIVRGCLAASSLGVLGGVALLILGPAVSSILTRNQAIASHSLMLPIGITLAATLLSQCVGIASLVPLGGLRSVARSALLGACAGLLGLMLLVPVAGAVGAAWSVAASELLVLGYQIFALRRRLRAPASVQPDLPNGLIR